MVSTTINFTVVEDPATPTEPPVAKIDNISISPTKVHAGKPLQIKYRISNIGKGNMIGIATVKMTCPGTVCVPAVRTPIRPIAAGASSNETIPMIIPRGAIPGNYNINISYEISTSPYRPTIPTPAPNRPDAHISSRVVVS